MKVYHQTTTCNSTEHEHDGPVVYTDLTGSDPCPVMIRLKLCECGWAIKREVGRWIHVQTGGVSCITDADVASWGK